LLADRKSVIDSSYNGYAEHAVEFAGIDNSRLMPMMQELMIVVNYA
jgi:hypothetical protein